MFDHDMYHEEPGRVRLPKEVTDQWDENGYGDVDTEGLYDVLWWIADQGYSIIPDADFFEYAKTKREKSEKKGESNT